MGLPVAKSTEPSNAKQLRPEAAHPLSRTPLFELSLELKGRMVPFSGWEMAVQYSGITNEHQAVRQTA
jgi:aminomethyltransferase